MEAEVATHNNINRRSGISPTLSPGYKGQKGGEGGGCNYYNTRFQILYYI